MCACMRACVCVCSPQLRRPTRRAPRGARGGQLGAHGRGGAAALGGAGAHGTRFVREVRHARSRIVDWHTYASIHTHIHANTHVCIHLCSHMHPRVYATDIAISPSPLARAAAASCASRGRRTLPTRARRSCACAQLWGRRTCFCSAQACGMCCGRRRMLAHRRHTEWRWYAHFARRWCVYTSAERARRARARACASGCCVHSCARWCVRACVRVRVCACALLRACAFACLSDCAHVGRVRA